MRILLSILVVSMSLLIADQVQASNLQSDDLWFRESVPGSENGAGFGTLRNVGDEDIVIVAGRSNVSADVELHRHVHRDNQMVMEQIEALTIPAGESVILQPGGYHFMLMQLKQPLVPGEEHQLILRLDTGERIEFAVPVKGLLQ